MSQQYPEPQNENQLVALGRALQTLREEENADVLIETTLDYLASEFKYRLIWIGLYDRLDHRLLGKGGITPTGETTLLHQPFNLNPGDLLEQVVIQQRPIGVPDLRQEVRAGEWRRAAQEFGIQGTLFFPLRCKDRCFGVALLGSHLWGVSPRPAEKAQLSLLLGGLAAALYQIEVEWQRSAIKRPDQPLFQVLDQLMQIPTLALRLEAVVTMTQEFVAPTRTNLYWYSPERRYFWHRIGNRESIRRFGDSRTTAAGLTVAEAIDFYQALATGQLVTIGAGRSILKPESTERVLARLRTRSLLAAPIQAKGELLGFLAVEDKEPRIWEEAEKNYVRATAQLVGLVAGNEELEATLQLASNDLHFSAEIAQALNRSNDTNTALKDCARLLCKRLNADRFLILQEDNNGQFAIIFQQQPLNRRPLITLLPPLSPEDKQWLFNSAEPVMVEDLDEDLRLVPWRECLSQLGVRSALLVPLGRSHLSYQMSKTGNPNKQERTPGSTSSAATLTPLLAIGQGTPRTWNQTEQELVSIVAEQMNLLLTLRSSSQDARLSFQAHQTLQAGLSTLCRAPLDPVLFERDWVKYMATLLECPLAALLSWTPESPCATVAAAAVADPRFALSPDLSIPVASDPLIQEALATSSFLCRSVAVLGASTRKWLNSPGIGQLLVIALHTSATPTTGILLLADKEERHWPHHLLPPLETLTQQFAWFGHYRHYLSRHAQNCAELQTLNWYKHRCLEILHQCVRESVSALLELEAKMWPVTSTSELNRPNPIDLGEISINPAPSSANPLRQMRRLQLLQQLQQTMAILTPVLKEEQWQLVMSLRPVALTAVLKRSLRRVEPLYHERQLILQVHHQQSKSVCGDQIKLECILFELLMTFCFHAQPGGRINLWCSPTSPESKATLSTHSSHPLVELLIADSGLLDECLNALSSSPSESPFSTDLKICQQISRSWGGDLQFYQLQGERYLMRLLLRLAS